MMILTGCLDPGLPGRRRPSRHRRRAAPL